MGLSITTHCEWISDMAFYSGSVNDMAALRSALVDACVGEGWVWNSSTEVLSKGTIFVRLQHASGYLRLYGRVSNTSGEMSVPQQMGPFTGWASAPLPQLSWPATYRLFLFDQEVYCVIQYNVDVFQWCAFGKSTIEGMPGTGTWVAATATRAVSSYTYGVDLSVTYGRATATNFCPAPFWAALQQSDDQSNVHSDIDGQGWWVAQSSSGDPVGISHLTPLQRLIPSAWNSEAVLLPIRAYKVRPGLKISLIVDLEHSRYTRVDNYLPGEVISLGSDRWMILPFYRKNSAGRDGGSSTNHSGTLGWAIRYEGP